MAEIDEDQNVYCTSLGSLSKNSIVATGAISAVIDRKAALSSPEFEGQPLAPDPTSESQPGQIANIGYVNKVIDGKRDKTDLTVYEQADYWEGTSTSGATVNLPLVNSSGYSKTYSNGSTNGCYKLQADDYRTIGGVFRVYLRVNRSGAWATVSIAPETSFDEITEVTTTDATPAYTFSHHVEAVPEQDNFLATTKGMTELLDGKVDKGGETDPLFMAWKDSKRIAVGNNAGAYTDGAIAIGNSTNATGVGAVAIGSGAKSEAGGAVEIGAGTNSTQNSLAFRGFQLAAVTTSGNDTVCKIPNERLTIDAMLSTSGAPADAKVTGEWIAAAENKADQSLIEVGQINDLIPTQASAENQLADKNFVNSSIATNTATFRGTSDSATLADFDAWLATLPADNNDYVFWRTVDSEGNTVYKRYKYNDDSSDLSDEPLAGHWLFEYELNNSSFTAEQWAAINSGITSGAAAKLDALPTAEALAQSLAGKMPSTVTGADIAVSSTDDTTIDAALAGKASTTDATLTQHYTDWVCDPTETSGEYPELYFVAWDTIPETEIETWCLFLGNSEIDPRFVDYVDPAMPDLPIITSATFKGVDEETVTATRTASGYIIGFDDPSNPNRNKPLASEAEAEALRTGKANDADVVHTIGDEMTGPLYMVGTSVRLQSQNKKTTVSFSYANITRTVYGSSTTTWGYPDSSGILALTTNLPYTIATKSISNNAVALSDRACNYVDARALGSSASLNIDFPDLVDGKSRDFVLAVECGANPPSISYAAFVTIMAEDASSLTPEEGMNIYSFKEFKTNMFVASRKLVVTVVDNSSENG